jgi:hypothetical protein
MEHTGRSLRVRQEETKRRRKRSNSQKEQIGKFGDFSSIEIATLFSSSGLHI